MLAHPVEPLPGVQEALEELSADYRLVLITKGDLFHQESKLAASGLGSFFSGVEIVSEKTAETYRRAFARHGAGAEQAAMVGNSVRSYILPALESRQLCRSRPVPPDLGPRGGPHPHLASTLQGARIPVRTARLARTDFVTTDSRLLPLTAAPAKEPPCRRQGHEPERCPR